MNEEEKGPEFGWNNVVTQVERARQAAMPEFCDYWVVQCAFWTAKQAAFISLGIDPRRSPLKDRRYDERLTLIERAIHTQALALPITPHGFWEWARPLELNMPDELKAAFASLAARAGLADAAHEKQSCEAEQKGKTRKQPGRKPGVSPRDKAQHQRQVNAAIAHFFKGKVASEHTGRFVTWNAEFLKVAFPKPKPKPKTATTQSEYTAKYGLSPVSVRKQITAYQKSLTSKPPSDRR